MIFSSDSKAGARILPAAMERKVILTRDEVHPLDADVLPAILTWLDHRTRHGQQFRAEQRVQRSDKHKQKRELRPGDSMWMSDHSGLVRMDQREMELGALGETGAASEVGELSGMGEGQGDTDNDGGSTDSDAESVVTMVTG